MFHHSLLCLCVLCTLIAPVNAQRRPPGGFKQPQMKDFDSEGTIEAVASRGAMFQMQTKSNETVIVAVAQGTKVHYSATATPDFLRTGLAVEFTAEVAKGGAVKEKVADLTVFTPSADRPLGLFPEGSAGGAKGKDDAPLGGLGGLDPAADAPAKGAKKAGKGKAAAQDLLGGLDDLGPPKPSGRKGGAPAVQLPAVCVIRGTITKCRGGNLAVKYGSGTATLELDEGVKINVELNNCAFAAKGDAVTVKGKAMEKRVMAEIVKVAAAQPLSSGKKQSVKPDRTLKAEKPAAKAGKAKKGGSEDDPLSQ